MSDVKPLARILDATAGNRTMWQTKDSPYILFIDIEPELEIKPDIIMDCTKTEWNFPDRYFNAIFFDPPHGWGKELGKSWMSLRNKNDQKNYPWIPSDSKTYYGWDKYKTKSQLLAFIHRAQQEFHRILIDEGLLWFKWDECEIPLFNILPFFKDWNMMLKIQIGAIPMVGNNPVESKSRSFWLMFMKKPKQYEEKSLEEVM